MRRTPAVRSARIVVGATLAATLGACGPTPLEPVVPNGPLEARAVVLSATEWTNAATSADSTIGQLPKADAEVAPAAGPSMPWY